ncbi:MAG: hypothetical protein M0R28_17615 [Pigmentiphaga sp.]|nr:hypothetical protein [Pigmentiphaga sp.]
MKLANYADVPWRFFANPRQGRIEFKTMLSGTDGDPNNYALVISRTEADFASPRHRHNFDQIRMSLENATNIGPKLNIAPGDIGYFPEGGHYGPQNQAEVGSSSLGLVIQFGGASGSGYMSMDQMERGALELAKQGTFEGGVYRAAPESAAKRRNRDGYEAIWSHVNGRDLQYPKPRYAAPVFVHPPAYDGIELAGQPGVRLRHLASFTERHIVLQTVELAAGAVWRHPGNDAPTLLFALSGGGRLSSGESWAPWSAIELAAHEALSITADAESAWFVLTLPALARA